MKANSSFRGLWKGVIHVALLLAGFVLNGFSQTTTLPVVTLRATDPFASWSGDPGVFTLFRDGPTNLDLNVYCRIDGTATNGVDYAGISSYVTIPAGVRTNSVVISPINLGQTNPATVVLTLAPSPLMPPVNYLIGSPSNAVVVISPNTVTNIPPWVYLTEPTNRSVFYTPVDIGLIAFAGDADGTVETVEFFAGDKSLGVASNSVVVDPLPGHPLPPPGARAFFLTWSNAPAGTYALSALATDNGGASTRSPLVTIAVVPGPPPTNLPPVVKITIPTNGATFYGQIVCPPCLSNSPPCAMPCYFVGPDISICADAFDPDGYVNTVEFFANKVSLGVRTNCLPCASPQNPFCLLWTNAPAGEYALTAKATDNSGAVTISDPIFITVSAGPAPTNYPPVVRITSPPNGTLYTAPVDVPIYAYAFDRDGSIASIEFFADGNSLGLGQGLCVSALSVTNRCPSNVYWLVWSNAPVGKHLLTALATDNAGATTLSVPVTIGIVPPPPPPTNRPPIISIAASDPIAIEGTNCWPWLGLTNPVPTWSNWVSPVAICRFFTNCGPKNATFVVRRLGDTNDSLTLPYTIGGTATNGVDYVPLSGVVTIPAGERKALITVVPLDDGPPDLNSTVVLSLLASTNSPPDYWLGYPKRAAALILERPWPSPISVLLPDKCFHLSAAGPDGAWFHIEYSTDLAHWTAICTNQVVNGSIDFVDPDAPTLPARFYRAVPELNRPGQ